MPIPDATSRQRLEALGIDVWLRRDRFPARAQASGGDVPSTQTQSGEPLRIRMASGDGEWLLVQRDPWTGQHETLLADIQAVLGIGHCRFGQWTRSASAGVAPEALGERGVRQVLSFGEPPQPVAAPHVHVAPALEELAGDAGARRRLWQILSPLLKD